MINIFKTFFLLLSIFLFSSCCTNVSKEKTAQLNSKDLVKNPTTVAVNKSIVTAKLLEISHAGSDSFVIKALLTKVEEDPSYPSMAIIGEVYEFRPNFNLDDNKNIILDSEKNAKLKSLSKMKKGDEFKAEVFFEGVTGWFIQDLVAQ